MKRNVILKHRLVLFFVFFISGCALGQPNLEGVLESFLNTEYLQKNHIRSVTIYADFNEDDITTHGGYGGKIAEIEYDDNGNQIYRLTSDNHGNLPVIEYGRGSKIVVDSFDLNNNKLYTYTETYSYFEQEIYEYDGDGNLKSTEYRRDSDIIVKTAFVWSEGKLIDTKTLYTGGIGKNTATEFNTEGRIVKHVSLDYRTDYSYERHGDTLITLKITHRSDSLYETEEYVTNTKFNKLIHYVRKNHRGELEVEMKADLDTFGNVVHYYLNDLTERYEDEPYPPITITVENEYNAQHLLVKRLFYFTQKGVGTDMLTKVERYFYDSEPLLFQLKKGALTEQEMIQEDFDGR